ncbi:hypothetical protein EU805_04865 [Salipiger sp. IMCC34102]|uniref:hypothetical protein n=1 Tax=Salipiger sp. IMCC34102 TaxID=2510647 RepID=UPI00101DF376|nr:hypothetical protein [Salipiger sp. IMCC34102]RYH03068.1 hypothetical protein EU805_04865 [Salipiger sp. IMCC34102]
MPQFRRPAHQITPTYEDRGLFRSDYCAQRFDLVPIVQSNSRKDLIVTALFRGEHVAPILFAGRRRRYAEQVMSRLEALRGALPATRSVDVFARRGALLPLEVEGTWRRLVSEDRHGILHRSYHFIAACWTLTLGDGRRIRFGLPPAVPVRTLD